MYNSTNSLTLTPSYLCKCTTSDIGMFVVCLFVFGATAFSGPGPPHYRGL